MEPKFENRFTRSVEVEKELYKYSMTRTPASIILYIFIALLLAVNIMFIVFWGVDFINILTIALCLICIGMRPIQYQRAIKLTEKRLNELNNGQMPEIVTQITDTELISHSSDREEPAHVPINGLKKLFITENYYMIRTDSKLVYAFKKGLFTIGNEAEFVPYIQNVIAQSKSKK